jgi:hypothetical protein
MRRHGFLARLKKHHANSKLFRQFNSEDASGLPKESLRNFKQQARAIAAAAIGVHASAMS